MSTSKFVFAFTAVTALAAVAGCSTEVPADDNVQASVDESGVDTATWHQWECTGASAATQHIAHRLFQYALGDDSYTFPAGTACAEVKAGMDLIREGIATDVMGSLAKSYYTICGLHTTRWTLINSTGLLYNAGTKLEANVDACYGSGVLAFLLPYTNLNASGVSSVYMDPEPATLTADLSATQGASAAAYWSTTLEETVAKKWSSTYATCTSGVDAGQACSTTALASGQETNRLIGKVGTSCRCL